MHVVVRFSAKVPWCCTHQQVFRQYSDSKIFSLLLKTNDMQTAFEATFKTAEELPYIHDKIKYQYKLTTELRNIFDM
jgi:hypothetical protein